MTEPLTEFSSVAFLDSENLFFSLGERAADAFFALSQWCDKHLASPRDHRSYGKTTAPGIPEIAEIAANTKTRIIRVGWGKNVADDRIVRDLLRVEAPECLLATGDLDLMKRAYETRALDWVVVAGRTSAAQAQACLPELPEHRIIMFAKLYAERMRHRDRAHLWPRGSIQGVAMPRWADLRCEVGFTEPEWRRLAFGTLRARGFNLAQADEASAVLSRWLPIVLPEHHHGLDDVEADDRWRWACLAAVAAAALEPGTSNRHIAVELFTLYEIDQSDQWEQAKARARRVVRDLWGDMGDREHILTRRSRRRRPPRR